MPQISTINELSCNKTIGENRVYGLDVFRALAILFVLVGHCLDHPAIPARLAAFNRVGVLGVELFFVLSGFLIGAIIIKLIDQNRFHNVADILAFWKRRWLRTLPLYYLVLLAFIRFGWQSGHGLLDYKSYYFFMQNFAYGIDNFFRISWSLAVEEHFYLWFPLLFLVWNQAVSHKIQAILSSALTLIIIAYAYRCYQPFFSDWDEYDKLIRRTVLSRLDAIMFGVLMAVAKYYWNRGFIWIRRCSPFIAAWFFMICAWSLTDYVWLMESRALQVNVFTIQTVCCALLLPWFDGLKNRRGQGGFFAVTSKLSYSLYLVHLLVRLGVDNILKFFNIYQPIYSNPFIIISLYFCGFYLVSWLTYSYIEKPFLELRDKSFNIKTITAAVWPSIIAGLVLLAF